MGYFNVTAKPLIPANHQNAGNIGDTAVLADWTEFEIPSGAAHLLGITALYRGKDGAHNVPIDFEIVWAKGNPDGTAPTSLGAVRSAVAVPTAGSPPWFNLIQGKTYVDVSTGKMDPDLVYLNTINVLNVAGGHENTAGATGYWNNNKLILQGEPISGSNVGYDKLYCALIGKGAHNFQTTLAINGTMSTSSPILTVDTIDANLVFAPGDVLHDEADLLLGTVKSVDSTTQITMESNLANASSNNQKVYNINPITLVLSFEN